MKNYWIKIGVAFLALWAIRGSAAILYVAVNSVNPTPPYGTWSTAAQDIQDAVNAANNGDEVLVTNGVYQTGGEVVTGSLMNRVVVSAAIIVQSVNGPTVTIIQGYQLPGTIMGDGAVRCVYLTNNATLSGFTLTNGATRGLNGAGSEREGGGIYCRGATAVVSNCVITGNAALTLGGGGYSGSFFNCSFLANTATNGAGNYGGYLTNCTLSGNYAYNMGGGANAATSIGCTFSNNFAVAGGGAYAGTLTNCILTGNSGGSGGGANSAVLQACLVLNNSATNGGGGVYSGTVSSSALTGNSAPAGGGAYGGGLANCTLTGNFALTYGGGTYNSPSKNCIIYYNNAPFYPNYYENSQNYCCTTPLGAGSGNITNEPQFASSFRISASSPCRGAGSAAYATGTDLYGAVWANPPAMGCEEIYPATATGALTVAIQTNSTNVVISSPLTFNAVIGGAVSSNLWSYGDGGFGTNQLSATHSWSTAGNFLVALRAFNNSNPGGISATVAVHVVTQQIYYVSANNNNPVAPYASWTTAAKNIQDAINAATVSGAEILVTNGWYNGGGRVVYGAISNRVAVLMPLVVASVNGPAVTTIAGMKVAGTTNGNNAVRCVYLTNGASLFGFTVTNGATRSTGDPLLEESGGGVWAAPAAGVVSNCVFTGNSAYNYGGGSYYANLAGCLVTNNQSGAGGGGSAAGTGSNSVFIGNSSPLGGAVWTCLLNNCSLNRNTAMNGGAAYGGSLNNCSLLNNSAVGDGGGINNGTLNTCIVSNNSAEDGGGGYSASMTSCTLVANTAYQGGGAMTEYDYPVAVLEGCSLSGNTATYGGGASQVFLHNCTLAGNTATNGGGAYSCTVSNGVLQGNLAAATGGGADGCSLYDCQVTGNSAPDGGGAASCSLNNCGLSGNMAAAYGGGSYEGTQLYNCTFVDNQAALAGGGDYESTTLENCILCFNDAPLGPNYYASTINYCCITAPLPYPPPSSASAGNIYADPQLADNFHLSANSPCRGAGSASGASGLDLDGNAWASPPSMGCNEFSATTPFTNLSAAIQTVFTNVAAGFSLNLLGNIAGAAGSSRWSFGDGVMASNEPCCWHAWRAPGNYAVILSVYNSTHPGGISATTTVQVVAQPVHYVAAGNANPVPPYSSWATAATNFQAAVNAATVPGALVLASNGVYNSGGEIVYGGESNRVAVTMPLALRSVNGPGVTAIVGGTSLRCVLLTNGSTLSGFTLTNASTLGGTADIVREQSGGGVWCNSPSVNVSNCVITGCSATYDGGGAYSGTLTTCTLTNNNAFAGGGGNATTFNNCLIINNTVNFYIEGASYGGGGYYCTFNNCTLTGNTWFGAAIYSTFNNCISYNNDSNFEPVTCTLNYCCTTPEPGNGLDNITNDPGFVNPTNNFHLQTNSPCINSGYNDLVVAGADLDGNPRVTGGTVDQGAYEFQNPASIISYAWLEQYGLATNGSADYLDADGTGMKNWQKWIAGLNPTNQTSVLAMLAVSNSPAGAAVSWKSVSGITYYLQRSGPAGSPFGFSTIQNNLAGQAGTNSFLDTGAVGKGPYFYRVGVQQ